MWIYIFVIGIADSNLCMWDMEKHCQNPTEVECVSPEEFPQNLCSGMDRSCNKLWVIEVIDQRPLQDIVTDTSLQDTHSDKQEHDQESGQWIGFQLGVTETEAAQEEHGERLSVMTRILEDSTGPKPKDWDGDTLLPTVPLGLEDLSAKCFNLQLRYVTLLPTLSTMRY